MSKVNQTVDISASTLCFSICNVVAEQYLHFYSRLQIQPSRSQWLGQSFSMIMILHVVQCFLTMHRKSPLRDAPQGRRCFTIQNTTWQDALLYIGSSFFSQHKHGEILHETGQKVIFFVSGGLKARNKNTAL